MFYPQDHLNCLPVCVVGQVRSCTVEHLIHECTLIKLACLITPENAARKQVGRMAWGWQTGEEHGQRVLDFLGKSRSSFWAEMKSVFTHIGQIIIVFFGPLVSQVVGTPQRNYNLFKWMKFEMENSRTPSPWKPKMKSYCLCYSSLPYSRAEGPIICPNWAIFLSSLRVGISSMNGAGVALHWQMGSGGGRGNLVLKLKGVSAHRLMVMQGHVS